LELNGLDQFLICADDVYPLGKNINTMKRNKEVLVDASKQVGLKVSAQKTKYMFMSHHQNARQSHNMNTAYKSFGNVTQSPNRWEW